MPAKSKAQFKAMAAAAHGHSTLGIPAKVGKEYTESSRGSFQSLPAHARTTNRKSSTHSAMVPRRTGR